MCPDPLLTEHKPRQAPQPGNGGGGKGQVGTKVGERKSFLQYAGQRKYYFYSKVTVKVVSEPPGKFV